MSEKVKLSIKCKQVVEYSQEVYVTAEEAELLNKHEYDHASDGEFREVFNVVNNYLNKLDVIDADQEFTDLEIQVLQCTECGQNLDDDDECPTGHRQS